jgi:hypothetical protein
MGVKLDVSDARGRDGVRLLGNKVLKRKLDPKWENVTG